MTEQSSRHQRKQWIFLTTLAVLVMLTLICMIAAKAEVPDYIGHPLTGEERDAVIARNSPLTEYVYLSPRAEFPRSNPIEKITIHYMAGDLTLEEVGDTYSRADRTASANYGIDSDGHIGLYVEECNASRTSGNEKNDSRAINIEVANDETRGRWHVSDAAYDALVALITDICIRNGIEEFTFTGDESGTLTLHLMFRDTTCPGNYLLRKIPQLVTAVNQGIRYWNSQPEVTNLAE